MSDDIVTRLRERQRELEFYWPDDDSPLTWVGEAADEIERLRAERDGERDLADQLASALLNGSFRGSSSDRRDRMYGSGWEAVHDALDVYEEARRG